MDEILLNYDYTLLFLIYLRMSGCILFNPVLGRSNVPVLIKVGISVLLTMFIYAAMPDPQGVQMYSMLEIILYGTFETLIGFCIGFVINIFLTTLIVAGEIMDMQVGLSMAKVYDPANNTNMPVTASILNAGMYILFFTTNSHLNLVRVIVHSGIAIPYGELALSSDVAYELALMLGEILIYAMKMAMPILAVEFICEMGVGIMMKAVPQLNIFSVNIQVKLIVGFSMILFIIPNFMSAFDRLFLMMFDNLNRVLFMMT